MNVVVGCCGVSTAATGKRLNSLPLTSSNGANDSRLHIRLRRGFKRCPSCGEINAQRAFLCRNLDCELRHQKLLKHRPFDPVQLIAYSKADLYSVRCKEKELKPRNFVQITDVTLALEQSSEIVSRNAICFVDTCKYDAYDVANLTCKHIKAITEQDKPTTRAEVYTVAHEVLWNLNIEMDQKMRLWDMYKEDERIVPAVQRLNDSTFVVKCAKSKSFPAGRLHVHILVNQTRSEKKPKHSCACKKLKIIVEADNSVVMQEEICDHLLLVLAAILSKQDGKTSYANFANALKSFWMPEFLNTPLTDGTQEDALFDFNISNAGNNSMTASTDDEDIFIFGNEFLHNGGIPDFADNILKSVDSLRQSNQSVFSDASDAINPDQLFHPGDPNLVSSCGLIEDSDINFSDINGAATVATADSVTSDDCLTHMELSDCNIELMDQFQQLTDQIDLCSEDIALPDATDGLFEANSINIMPLELTETVEPLNNSFVNGNSMLPTTLSIDMQSLCKMETTPATLDFIQQHTSANSLLNYNNNNAKNNNNIQTLVQLQQLQPTFPPTSATLLPPIEMPTIAMVMEEPRKASEIVNEVKTRRFPHLTAKRSFVVNDVDSANKAHIANVETGPALAYSTWLDYVIDMINESVTFDSDELVKHSFHVHEEIFAHFSKSFSMGKKRRMPTSSCIIETGKYKGLMKYTWIFSTASTVKHIFTTRGLSIELERLFEKSDDGYVRYVKRPPSEATKKCKRIYPKLALYVAYVWFECCNNSHKTAFKIEWLPNAFPKSHFGVLNIEFSLGYRYPNDISSQS